VSAPIRCECCWVWGNGCFFAYSGASVLGPMGYVTSGADGSGEQGGPSTTCDVDRSPNWAECTPAMELSQGGADGRFHRKKLTTQDHHLIVTTREDYHADDVSAFRLGPAGTALQEEWFGSGAFIAANLHPELDTPEPMRPVHCPEPGQGQVRQ
jgi:hypothetical protein